MKNEGLTQTMIQLLSKASPSHVSKYISTNQIKPIDIEKSRNLKYSIEDSRSIIAKLGRFSINLKNKRYAFYNFKGGTGKTSICYQVSSHIALLGYKVLVIDADPQAHLTTSFGIPNDNQMPTLYDALFQRRDPKNLVQTIFTGLDLLPSNLSLSRLEHAINDLPQRERRLELDFAEIDKDYDFVFIDTSPFFGFLNKNVINYCDVLNIVCETQPYSLNGLKILIEELENFWKLMQVPLPEINIIPNKYEEKSSSTIRTMNALKEYYGDYLKDGFWIRKSEDIITSSEISKPLAFFAKKNSIALEDILDLVKNILDSAVGVNIEKDEKEVA